VVNVGYLASNDVGLAKVTTVRNNRVTGFDRTGNNLWKERLVGHVWKRVNQGNLGLALSQVLFKLLSSVETGVTATDDEDLWHGAFQKKKGNYLL
jgi:hypothetical protein